MRPVLIEIGIFQLHSYVVCMALGLLVGVYLGLRENNRLPNPYPVTGKVGIWGLIGGLIGARIYFVIQYDGLSHLYNAIVFWGGGYVFFGGAIGGAIAVWIYLRRQKVPFLPVSDIGVPYLALGHAIGRLGCFLNGCCWGDLCRTSWGITFPQDSGVFDNQAVKHLLPVDKATSLPIHPTQLYETLGLLMVFFLLKMIYKDKKYNGQVFLWYFCLYGAWRFFDENFRGDSSHTWFGMTSSQLISLIACLVSGLLIFILHLTIVRKKNMELQTTETVVDTTNESVS